MRVGAIRALRGFQKKAAVICILGGVGWQSNCFANYSCYGQVAFLGVDESGDIAVQLQNSTPIHKVCNVNTQGSFHLNTASCKAAYGALLSAKLTGKTMTIYYNDNGMTCSTLVAWAEVPGTYFIQGPD